MIRQSSRATSAPKKQKSFSSKKLIAGRYRPGKAMAILFERLSDEKKHRLSVVLAELPVGKPPHRLYWLKRHGCEEAHQTPGQLYRWTTSISKAGDLVQIKLQPK